ncbi:HSP20-like chaperone [Thozetella sp. PMI_491]|nr:HSP20-like chaperone [Thozetella sp. PMI_491]
MSFFPLHGSDRCPVPLLRPLDGFDSYSREVRSSTNHHRRIVRHAFSPKFDVREKEGAYELYGELPGVRRDNIQIEFSDPQTLLVQGHVEHAYTARTSQAGLLERTIDPHVATVQSGLSIAGSTGAAELVSSQERPRPTAEKHWIAERSMGDFSRPFGFSARIVQDLVTANLNNGMLTIVVPKAKKHEVRRITVGQV